MAWPEGVARSKTVPAVVVLHSYGGTGYGLIRSGRMVKTLLSRGYVVIAPEGLGRRNGAGNDWEIKNGQNLRRDDVAFIQAVANDAANRAGIDRNTMLLAGFSVGGSMVTYVACEAPKSFKGFAPVSGSFWLPQPMQCEGAANVYHSHGASDTTMPLTGRRINAKLRQGNVNEAMETFAAASGCGALQNSVSGSLKIKRWLGCGRKVEFALHPGGHAVPKEWATRALEWFESL
jgi:polyhydroxybutyrate depolymerase